MKIKGLEFVVDDFSSDEEQYLVYKDGILSGKVQVRGERVYIYKISHNITNLIYNHVVMGNHRFAPQERSYWLNKTAFLLEPEFPE
jgi:hypothetical protein